jgi:hypothetical protein
MSSMPAAAKILVVVGLLSLLAGLLLWKFPGAFSWFGKLPGDIRHEGEDSRVYVPIVSMLVLSAVLTLLVNLVGWLLRRIG